MMKLDYKNFFLIFLSSFFLMQACKNEKFENEDIVATVGDFTITANELKKNYEFGFSNLKSSKDSKENLRNYLELMINELALTAKGIEMGFDKSKEIMSYQKELENDLMLEAFIREKIEKDIHVSDAEIREAINKSKVSFKFRFWAEPTAERAKIIHDEMIKHGFSDVVTKVISQSVELGLDPSNYETEYLTWQDVSEEVFQSIQNLEIGEISKPIQIDDIHYIFQLMDIRREGIIESEYLSKAPTMKKVIFNSKIQKKLVFFLDSLLTPMNFTVKAGKFDIFSNSILEWQDNFRSKDFIDAVNSASSGYKSLSTLKKDLDQVFIDYSDGSITYKEFIEFFDFDKVSYDPQSRPIFKYKLNSLIRNSIRDYFLIKEAEKEKLNESFLVERELENWKNKWISDITRNHLLNTQENNNLHSVSSKKNITEFMKTLSSIKKNLNIKIYDEVLDTIKVEDSKKSKWANYQIYKGGSGRQIIPLVDPSWAEISFTTYN